MPRPLALLLDVDGTLYRQGPVRARMAWRLACHAAIAPRAGLRAMRVLHAFRWAHESLRRDANDDVHERQYRLAARVTRVPEHEVRALVRRWMLEAPCDLIARHRRTGLLAFLDATAGAGLPVGVVSDYPARAKLAALGLATRLATVRSAFDPDVARLKPAPDGLLAAAADLGVPAGACAYVGDRVEVDAAAARAAGMRAWIIGAPGSGPGWRGVRDFPALGRALGLGRRTTLRRPDPLETAA